MCFTYIKSWGNDLPQRKKGRQIGLVTSRHYDPAGGEGGLTVTCAARKDINLRVNPPKDLTFNLFNLYIHMN